MEKYDYEYIYNDILFSFIENDYKCKRKDAIAVTCIFKYNGETLYLELIANKDYKIDNLLTEILCKEILEWAKRYESQHYNSI